MLGYTLEKMLERHELFIERDEGHHDEFGADKRDWKPFATIKGLFWWLSSRGEGIFQEVGDPERTAFTAAAGALVHKNAPVTEGDRVSKVVVEGGIEVLGPFRIVSVREYPTHMAFSLERP